MRSFCNLALIAGVLIYGDARDILVLAIVSLIADVIRHLTR